MSTIANCPHILEENLIPLAEACKRFPVRCSRQTLERWLRRGARGVILESVTIGSRRFVSTEGIARFLSGQAGAKTGDHTLCLNRPRNNGRMSTQEIAEKSREYGLPE